MTTKGLNNFFDPSRKNTEFKGSVNKLFADLSSGIVNELKQADALNHFVSQKSSAKSRNNSPSLFGGVEKALFNNEDFSVKLDHKNSIRKNNSPQLQQSAPVVDGKLVNNSFSAAFGKNPSILQDQKQGTIPFSPAVPSKKVVLNSGSRVIQDVLKKQGQFGIEGIEQTIRIAPKKDLAKLIATYSNELGKTNKNAKKYLVSLLPGAVASEAKLDTNSQFAVETFASALDDNMSKSQMAEALIRYSRLVSNMYPEAFKQLETIFSTYAEKAIDPAKKLDSDTKFALDNFALSLNSNMTKEQMTEALTRYSRLVSNKFPDAFKQLETTLSSYMHKAFDPNSVMDGNTHMAISYFPSALNENMTRDQMEEMLVRYSRLLSNRHPEAFKLLESVFSANIGKALDENKLSQRQADKVVQRFEEKINWNNLSKEEFDKLYKDHFDELSIKSSKALLQMDLIKNEKAKGFKLKEEEEKNDHSTFEKIKKDFNSLVEGVNELDNRVQNAVYELKNTYNEYNQTLKKQEITRMLSEKDEADTVHAGISKDMKYNDIASMQIKDNYNDGMAVDITPPEKEKVDETKKEELSEYDMVRSLKRNDLKQEMTKLEKEDKADMMYDVPTFHLVNGVQSLSHEEQLKALTSVRFEEALIRDMPRKQLIDMLPDAYEMIPALMVMKGDDSDDNNGMGLVKKAISTKHGGGEDAMNKMMPEEKSVMNMEGVSDYQQARFAVAELSNDDAQKLKKILVSMLDEQKLLKLNWFCGKSAQEMAKELPYYVMNDQLRKFNKPQIIEAYKNLDESYMEERAEMLSNRKMTKSLVKVMDRKEIEEKQIFEKGVK